MSISHKFLVDGLPGDYDECAPLAIEVRCTHCGSSQRYGDDQMTTPLRELVEWAEAHKCRRGQVTNTTGRSTDRPLRTNIKQDGQPDFADLFGDGGVYSRPKMDALVEEFRRRHPEAIP